MMVRRLSKRFNRAFSFFLISAVFSACVSGQKNHENQQEPPQQANAIHVELSTERVAQGSVLLITAHLPSTVDPAFLFASFGDLSFPFFPVPELGTGSFQALLGIPLALKPGSNSIRIRYRNDADRSLELSFAVMDGNYPSEVLKVDPGHIHPNLKNLERIRREATEIGKVYSQVTHEKFWRGPFVLPIQSETTSRYGTKRIYNGEMQSFHSGLDLKAAVGTPVSTAAPGVVAFAKNLFLTGNTILVDHGFGVFTVYAHLNQFKVKVGKRVQAGQLLGLSGQTGRVSGPHLHFSTVVHHVKVDPIEFLRVVK